MMCAYSTRRVAPTLRKSESSAGLCLKLPSEDVARRIHRVLTVCKPERLCVNPGCGFGRSPAAWATRKSGPRRPAPSSRAGS